jgi:hypothetical protein
LWHAGDPLRYARRPPEKFKELVEVRMSSLKHPTYLVLLFSLLAIVLLIICGNLAVTDAAPFFAAVIAGLVALSINETVRQRRARELEAKLREQREQAYSDVIGHLLQSFTGGPTAPEFEIRSKIALWASADFLKQYVGWKESIGDLAGRGPVRVPPEKKQSIQENLGRVCVAARKDLSIESRDTPSFADIASMLFDDYSPLTS